MSKYICGSNINQIFWRMNIFISKYIYFFYLSKYPNICYTLLPREGNGTTEATFFLFSSLHYLAGLWQETGKSVCFQTHINPVV